MITPLQRAFSLASQRPPMVVIKRSPKNFDMSAFLRDVAAVNRAGIDVIPCSDDAQPSFKDSFSTVIDKHAWTVNRCSPLVLP